MFRMKSFIAAPAVALLLSGTAHAALTADQVWQSWKDAAAKAGLEVSAATENKDGGKLTLNGVAVGLPGAPVVTISDMVMTEAADGSVAIVPGADIGVAVTGDTKGSVKLTHEGLTLTARDANGGLAYDFAAAKMDLVYDTTYPGMSFDGSPAPDVKSSGTVGFANLSGTYSDTPGTNRTFAADIKADTLAYKTLNDDPSLELKQTSESTTSDIAMSFSLALPSTIVLGPETSPADFGKALQEGLAIRFSTKQGDSVGSMIQESPSFGMTFNIKAGAGEGTGEFNKDVFSIRSTGAGLEVDTTSPMMPAPVKVTSGPIEFAMSLPVTAPETAGDFAFLMKLNQLSINEEAWAMIDPGKAIPRDAADLAIDITGKTKMDLPGMITAEETGGVPAVPQPESLDIKQLMVKAAGAALTGTGAFTFDNSMGVPMPLGAADVSVTGANKLIDGLIATGLVAAEDATGIRMMMGMFMKPGAGADELTTKVEAKEGFSIFVNGQQIQ
jgi:Uncharacterized protein conserved in bacteria (DUF2125)